MELISEDIENECKSYGVFEYMENDAGVKCSGNITENAKNNRKSEYGDSHVPLAVKISEQD